MNIPKISICVPSLNTRPYLGERFQTILDQSLQDWELLVYDSFSEDGSWEYIQELASREPRMHAWQGPRQGAVGSWNPCVQAAKGKYVYIATSDDTMPRDCLAKLAKALDQHDECDLAHCRLRMIDVNGQHVEEWWSLSPFARSSNGLVDHPHVRLAPLDGFLHLTGHSVYISITQLLIRRTLFDRVGPFESKWGGMSDFNWCMRASLVGNSVHVPDTWGGWRVRAGQATAAIAPGSSTYLTNIEEMIADALQRSTGCLALPIQAGLESGWARVAQDLRQTRALTEHCHSSIKRRARLLAALLLGSRGARLHISARLRRRSSDFDQEIVTLVQSWLRQAGIDPLVAG